MYGDLVFKGGGEGLEILKAVRVASIILEIIGPPGPDSKRDKGSATWDQGPGRNGPRLHF